MKYLFILVLFSTILFAEWTVKSDISKVNGEKRCFIKKDKLISVDGENFTSFSIATNGKEYWAHFFSIPALDLKDEYFESIINFDDLKEEISMENMDNEGMVIKINGKDDVTKIIKNFKINNSAIVEFIKSNNEIILFEIDLKGFSKAYSNAKAMCMPKKIKKSKNKKFYHPQWEVKVGTDRMTGKKQCSIHSKFVSSINSMDFPYKDTKSSISVYLHGINMIYPNLYFTDIPNLSDESLVGNSYASTRRVKFDDKIEKLLMLHKPGSKVILLPPEKRLIRNLSKHNTFITELDWYGNGIVQFKYNIKGFEEALKNAKYQCGIK